MDCRLFNPFLKICFWVNYFHSLQVHVFYKQLNPELTLKVSKSPTAKQLERMTLPSVLKQWKNKQLVSNFEAQIARGLATRRWARLVKNNKTRCEEGRVLTSSQKVLPNVIAQEFVSKNLIYCVFYYLCYYLTDIMHFLKQLPIPGCLFRFTVVKR